MAKGRASESGAFGEESLLDASYDASNPLLDDEDEYSAHGVDEEVFNPLLDAGEESEEEVTLPGVGSLRHAHPPQAVEAAAPSPFKAYDLAPEPAESAAEAVGQAEDYLLDELPSLPPAPTPPAGGAKLRSTPAAQEGGTALSDFGGGFEDFLGGTLTGSEEDQEDERPLAEDELPAPLTLSSLTEDLEVDVNSLEFKETWGDLTPPEEEEEGEGDAYLHGFDLDRVLSRGFDLGASDVDLNPRDHVGYSILGKMTRAEEFGILKGEVTLRLQQSIISSVLDQDFVEELELDTSYVLSSGPYAGRRTRLSIGKTQGEVFLVFRLISDVIPTPEEVAMPQELMDWLQAGQGLVIVGGSTGTGKTTTFASAINHLNLTQPKKIITLERPIEYLYPRGKSYITAREIGRDARSFINALSGAVRQHPDIILVGEVRNRVEVDALLFAAESGHLTLTTMHTNSASSTLSRVQSLFESGEQKRVLNSLGNELLGIVNQVLVLSKDGTKRFPVREILELTPESSKFILEGDVRGLREHQYRTKRSMEHGLAQAVVEGLCTVEEARPKAPRPAYFDELLRERKRPL